MKKVKILVDGSYCKNSNIGEYKLSIDRESYKITINNSVKNAESKSEILIKGIIKGIKIVKLPSQIEVCTSVTWGVSDIIDKNGKIKSNVPNSKKYAELKNELIQILISGEHSLITTVNKELFI